MLFCKRKLIPMSIRLVPMACGGIWCLYSSLQYRAGDSVAVVAHWTFAQSTSIIADASCRMP